MAKSTMVLWLACLVLQVLETSADNYSILLTYDANVSSSTAQTRFNNWATACGDLRGNSFTFSYFPAINDGVSLKGFRNMSAMLEELNVVGVLGGANYYLSLLNQTPNKTCGTGTQLNASTLDISMTGMVEVGVAYINFLRSHQNTGDYDRITQSETTIIALPKYFTSIANPLEVEQLLDGAANLGTPMNVFWYTQATDSTVLGSVIGQQQPTNVIALLNTDDINALIEYAYQYDLFDWSMRWVLMSPYGALPNLPSNVTVINPNVTVIGLGNGNLGVDVSSLSGIDQLAIDAADIAFAYLNNKCFSCVTQPTPNLTGSFDLVDPQTPRRSTAYSIYRNLGAAQAYIGSIVVETAQTPNITVSPVYAYNGTTQEVLTMLRTRPLRIVAALATPFVMMNNNKLHVNNLSSKVDFSSLTGLSVDIMKKILERSNASYTLMLYAGAATDLLNFLKTGQADIAIGNYAVLPELAASFDFLSNYLFFTYSVLEAPSRSLPVGSTLFDFFGPLTAGFWVLIIFSTIITALALATVNYFSPNRADYGFIESIFVTFGCLFHGLSASPPNQWSSRILISVWWMFVLFFVIIYAANYGALKAQSGMFSEVSGFDVRSASLFH
uniref:Glutamate receptor n=1 Tax=Schistocephalus solidus TaxID=70667 RepID=A0A0X3PTI8_SCHSO